MAGLINQLVFRSLALRDPGEVSLDVMSRDQHHQEKHATEECHQADDAVHLVVRRLRPVRHAVLQRLHHPVELLNDLSTGAADGGDEIPCFALVDAFSAQGLVELPGEGLDLGVSALDGSDRRAHRKRLARNAQVRLDPLCVRFHSPQESLAAPRYVIFIENRLQLDHVGFEVRQALERGQVLFDQEFGYVHYAAAVEVGQRGEQHAQREHHGVHGENPVFQGQFHRTFPSAAGEIATVLSRAQAHRTDSKV